MSHQPEPPTPSNETFVFYSLPKAAEALLPHCSSPRLLSEVIDYFTKNNQQQKSSPFGEILTVNSKQPNIKIFQAHLLLAKCHRGQGDLKSAILSCNSSIHHHRYFTSHHRFVRMMVMTMMAMIIDYGDDFDCYSTWKEPFLYRSACFQV